MECPYCQHVFNNKSSLHHHQKTTAYCLKKQGKRKVQKFKCIHCEKNYTQKRGLDRHQLSCKKYQSSIQCRDITNNSHNSTVSNNNSTTNNTITNNYVLNVFTPLTEEFLLQQAQQYYSMEHFCNGAAGLVSYALDFPLKGNAICTDPSRKRVKFVDKNGRICTNMSKMEQELAGSIIDSYKKRSNDRIKSFLTTLLDKDENDDVTISQCISELDPNTYYFKVVDNKITTNNKNIRDVETIANGISGASKLSKDIQRGLANGLPVNIDEI